MSVKTENLKRYLHWWFDFKLPDFKERWFDTAIMSTRLIPVIVGPRRSGKSTLFYQLITKLRKDNPHNNILYVNFEDDRIAPLTGDELADMLNIYRQTIPASPDFPVYLFLDEIQNLPSWEKTIRRIYETESQIRLFLTGSNSKMFSGELATSLRGRTISFKMFSLNFWEYLIFKNFPVSEPDELYYSPKKNDLLFLLGEYLRYGGFPEVVLEKEISIKVKILREYFRAIFFADIIERNQVRNIEALEAFVKILSRQMASLFSVGKLNNTLKSIGLKVSKNTLYTYLSFLEDAFFGKSVPIYSYSIKDQFQYPKKYYLMDNGLYNVVSFLDDADKGRLLENMVFLHLYKKYEKIHYWKNGSDYEVDFVLPELLSDKNTVALIQCAYNLSDDTTRKREIRVLVKAAVELRTKKAIILTFDTYEKIEIENLLIEVIPFYQWALHMEQTN